MAKPRKGVVPPQLRAYLFKKGRKSAKRAAAAPKVVRMARRRRGRSRRGRGRAAVPLITTVLATAPAILVGVHAASDIRDGIPAATAGGIALRRIGSLYGASPAESTTLGGVPIVYDAKLGYGALFAAVIFHAVAKKAGIANIRIAKGVALA